MALRRIIFVNRVYWPEESATAQLLTDLAEALAARGHEVHVLARGPTSGSRGGVTIHRTGRSGSTPGLFGRVLAYTHFLIRARQMIGRLTAPGDTIVLKTDPPLLAAFLTRAARKRGAAVVHWIQDIYPEIVRAHAGSAFGYLLAPLRAARDRAWRQSSACVTVGADMRAIVEARGVKGEHIHHFPNWAPRELESAPSRQQVAEQRFRWGLESRFAVAYSGNFGRVHQFDALLQAAERLKARQDIVFLLIGDGPRAAEVHSQIVERKLTNVRMLPSVARSELPAALAAPDLQVVTLRPGFESLVNPSKLAGVLAAGRPVIFVGPKRSDAARLVRDSGAGLIFAPGDGVGLAEAIEALSVAPDRMTRMGQAARAAYASGFRFEDQLARWETLLTSTPPQRIAIAPGAGNG